MTLSLQPIWIRTESNDGEGRLVLAEGVLVAILIRLSADHGAAAGYWFLEAGFGSLAYPRPPAFLDLTTALDWITQRCDQRP